MPEASARRGVDAPPAELTGGVRDGLDTALTRSFQWCPHGLPVGRELLFHGARHRSFEHTHDAHRSRLHDGGEAGRVALLPQGRVGRLEAPDHSDLASRQASLWRIP
jgi:hypothetical protein